MISFCTSRHPTSGLVQPCRSPFTSPCPLGLPLAVTMCALLLCVVPGQVCWAQPVTFDTDNIINFKPDGTVTIQKKGKQENVGTELLTPDDIERIDATAEAIPGVVNCAKLMYGNGTTSRCFSGRFLTEAATTAHITTNPELIAVPLESAQLFSFPFSVMTGEGEFELTPEQRDSLRNYLTTGGFVVASAGCSSPEWQESFRREITAVFPETPLRRIPAEHPVFQTVFSEDGLNDTASAGGNCCCCGGNEIRNSRQMNVNLLAYTLTH